MNGDGTGRAAGHWAGRGPGMPANLGWSERVRGTHQDHGPQTVDGPPALVDAGASEPGRTVAKGVAGRPAGRKHLVAIPPPIVRIRQPARQPRNMVPPRRTAVVWRQHLPESATSPRFQRAGTSRNSPPHLPASHFISMPGAGGRSIELETERIPVTHRRTFPQVGCGGLPFSVRIAFVVQS